MASTIYALSSGAPPAAIAVVRVSGPLASAAAEQLGVRLPPPRRVALRTLRGRDGAVLDRALVLFFPADRSATGEDLVEFHLHGGRAVVRAVEGSLAALPGLRPAEAGEFTRRAMLNGRIDLTEAEGLGDLLSAETETQRVAALRTAGGALRDAIGAWTDRALQIAGEVEALLDHGDEDDVVASGSEPWRGEARTLSAEIGELAEAPTVERLRDGIRVVLAGPPNSGKSSLLNRLAGREAAIVTPIAGTTRDVIEVPVQRDGVAWLFTDTAGIHEDTDDPVEQIGIERARARLAEADIVLWLGDDAIADRGAVHLHARCDLAGREAGSSGAIAVSALTGEGVANVWRELIDRARTLLPAPDTIALNHRQRDLCRAAAVALAAAAAQDELVLAAESVRGALRAFDRLTGRADTEAVLDALFARFCIGK